MAKQSGTDASTGTSVAKAGDGGRRAAPRWMRWTVNASLVGLVASISIHFIIALLAAGIVVAVGDGFGTGGPRGVEVGVELLTETELTSLEEAAISGSAPADDALPEFQAPQVDLSGGVAAGTGASGATSDLEGMGGAGLGGSGGGGDGIEDGGGFGGGSGGGGGAKFFGVEARGSRFAYIVDVSGSMAGPKLDALRTELRNSIDGLATNSSYVIVLYSSNASPLGGRMRWQEASDRNKKSSDQQVQRISASGGTNPEPAFEDVFTLRPRPDAIYFMTDGLFEPNVSVAVSQLNGRGERVVPVHCISFVSRESETILRRIAEDSDGTYTHVEGPSGVFP